ncbi:9420_t:CDS:2 [Acaulospora colombiana]|uniref:9420_t:CDS:1 n=1 Tax=Acaulospora colombiana TaxID=27376 RepID=A0ACA9PQ77_9GLOM|nr:9420_t:CDS:2 [Acaulospora colombiana]
MPHLHTLFSKALDPDRLHTIMLTSTTGAIVVSACSIASQERKKATIVLAALAAETWTNVQQDLDKSQSGRGPEGDSSAETSEIQGGWATTEVSKIQTQEAHHDVDQDAMFLVAVSGPEEAGWELLEERAKLLAEHLAPIFAEYTDSMAETPPLTSSRLPNVPRQGRSDSGKARILISQPSPPQCSPLCS